MDCSEKLSDDKKAIFSKIDFKTKKSPYVRLVLKILAEGFTIQDIIEAKTEDVARKKYGWTKSCEEYITPYFRRSGGRIGPTYFFGKYISGSENDEKVTKEQLLKNFYNTLYKEISKDELKSIMSYDNYVEDSDVSIFDEIEAYRVELLKKNNAN